MNKKLYDMMDWEAIEAIVYSEEPQPDKILGPVKIRGGYLIHAFYPDAVRMVLRLKQDGRKFPMEQVDDAGVFAVFLPKFCDLTEKHIVFHQ